MLKRRGSTHRWIGGLVMVMGLMLTACGDGPTGPAAPEAIPTEGLTQTDGFAALRPQPEPPGLVRLGFVALPDGDDWYGELWETVGAEISSCGSIELQEVESLPTGKVGHVSFTLTLRGANPDFVLTADVAGIMNTANGLISLNGLVTDGVMEGSHTHINGRYQPLSGVTGAAGYVMLRPQPEPPGSPAGLAFPPSPCAT